MSPYLSYKEVPSIDLFPWANRSIIVPGVPRCTLRTESTYASAGRQCKCLVDFVVASQVPNQKINYYSWYFYKNCDHNRKCNYNYDYNCNTVTTNYIPKFVYIYMCVCVYIYIYACVYVCLYLRVWIYLESSRINLLSKHQAEHHEVQGIIEDATGAIWTSLSFSHSSQTIQLHKLQKALSTEARTLT